MEYREASKADLPAICALGHEVNALHHEAWPHIFAAPGKAERDRETWAQGIAREGAATFVAESAGRVVAFVAVAVHDETSSLMQHERYARVNTVSVAREERGKGIGRELMALAERWAVAHGARDLRLNVWAFNEHALHVYRELGFARRSINLGKQLAVPAAPQPIPMDTTSPSWEHRLAAAWQSFHDDSGAEFVAAIESLVAELPAGDAIGLFERACAHDSTGHPDEAVPLYQAALASGLPGLRRRRAVIQLSSSLRNLGRPQESIALLETEILQPDDELSAAVRAFLALALASVGKDREALAGSLQALSTYLPRYNASLARYARELVEPNA